MLLVAGAKGAIATTLAAAVAALVKAPELVRPYLTTRGRFPYLGPLERTCMAGWDTNSQSLQDALALNAVLPNHVCRLLANDVDRMPIKAAPAIDLDLKHQVDQLCQDITEFKKQHPHARPVMVNLLPAGGATDVAINCEMADLYRRVSPARFPDMAYTLAAVESGIPVINFTPNPIEFSAVIDKARRSQVPLAGRDGKTGQTYLKVVLASALKARQFTVDGWYSLNILGNADGKNLMNPERAAEKLAHKTDLLDDILQYPVGNRYGVSSHKVHIDYYPPRGDAKEAWDVIDFNGLFDLSMSIRVNLQGRDSILAAPLVLDLGRWLVALQLAGKSGLVPELGFYFKKPLGENPPLTFQAQLAQLTRLERFCDEALGHPERA
jgi:myo-inositol-1-phosphate synthase